MRKSSVAQHPSAAVMDRTPPCGSLPGTVSPFREQLHWYLLNLPKPRISRWVPLMRTLAILLGLVALAQWDTPLVWIGLLSYLGVVGLITLLRYSVLSHTNRAVSPTPVAGTFQPRFSIHVPIHRESPSVVRRTLNSLAVQRFGDFEVIVIDNNTPSPELWEPVQAHCKRLGAKFRFFHADLVTGYKAGALNLCLGLADARSTHVVILDADYRVGPGFLERVAREIRTRGNPAFLQFPQAYEKPDAFPAITADYNHYFDTYLSYAERHGAVLLTGTLSVISVDALRRTSGWKCGSLTEDAELGVSLNDLGLRGHYLPSVAGRGSLPATFSSLSRQRERWVYGNTQTLLGITWAQWRKLGWRRSLAVLAQLTAWYQFWAVPLLCLAIGLIPGLSPDYLPILRLSALSLLAMGVFKGAFLVAVPRRLEPETRSSWKALLAQGALSWVQGTAWIKAVLGYPLGFNRTQKTATCTVSGEACRPYAFALGLTLLSLGYSLKEAWGVAALLALFALFQAFSVFVSVREIEAPGLLRPVPSRRPHG